MPYISDESSDDAGDGGGGEAKLDAMGRAGAVPPAGPESNTSSLSPAAPAAAESKAAPCTSTPAAGADGDGNNEKTALQSAAATTSATATAAERDAAKTGDAAKDDATSGMGPAAKSAQPAASPSHAVSAASRPAGRDMAAVKRQRKARAARRAAAAAAAEAAAAAAAAAAGKSTHAAGTHLPRRRPPSPRDSLGVPLEPAPRLHYLAQHCMLDPLRAALDKAEEREAGAAADVANQVDARGYTALMYACEQREPSYQVVQALMRAKADADIREPIAGMAPLHYVCHYGHVQVLNVLLRSRANPNVPRSGDGFTPLMVAAKQLQPDAALLLLKAKADPAARAAGDRHTDATALHMAAEAGSFEIVDLLCQLPKTPLNARRATDKGTALYAAVVKGHRAVVARLVEAKASVDAPNKKRVTPLMTTKVLGHDGLTRLLEQAGAKSWVGYDDR